MLYSMTGFGEAQYEGEGVSLLIEIKSLNNRFLKTVIKVPDALAFAEPHVDRIIRTELARGSVTCVVHMRYTGEASALEVNQAAMQAYLRQVNQLLTLQPQRDLYKVDLALLLQLPGVCQPRGCTEQEHERLLNHVTDLTRQALAQLREMRAEEGKSLAADLASHCRTIRERLDELAGMTDIVVARYHDRLRQRVDSLLSEAKIALDQDILAREVAVFAERCDIHEEIARLRSHLGQFAEASDSDEQAGRRLDFLTQEMLREANTISSKANSAEISRHVVEIKVAIDRLKEQIQNVE